MNERGEVISLVALGDIALGGAFVNAERDRAIVRGLKQAVGISDICFASLDCTFGSGTGRNPAEYVVNAPDRTMDTLVDLGANVVSLANNHSLDHGAPGLLHTQRQLAEREIEFVGAGADSEEAGRPLVVAVKGIRVGFLAYASTHPWVGSLAATAESAGVAPLEADRIEAGITQLHREVDWVVVSAHWGKENLHLPSPECRALGRRMIDWGAHIVLGHHPHVIQGREVWAGGHIFYSLGNCLYPDYPDQGLHFGGVQRQSLLVRFAISSKAVSIAEIVPLEMDDACSVNSLLGEGREEVEELLERWSRVLVARNYNLQWRQWVREAEVRRLSRVFREEVLGAGWSGGTKRLLTVGGKGLRSVGRSVREIFGFGVRES